MLTNHFKTAWRSLRNNKGFSIINMIGLSVGVAASLLIILYVVDEMSYDKHHVNAERIYRITQKVRLNGNEGSYAVSEKPLKDAIQSLPEIERAARLVTKTGLFLSPQKFFVKKDNIAIEEKKVVYTDSDLFDVFSLPMIEGDATNALTNPYSAVITEKAAKKYFNSTSVIGQTLTINDSNIYKITGVIKDIPVQSHFNYDFFLSYSSIPESKVNSWGYSGIHNYVLVKPEADIATLEKKIRAIEIDHFPPAVYANDNYLNVVLTPLTRIHLYSNNQYEIGKGGNIQYVYIFSVVAFLILLIACINFINLSTARSANRSKEVGVRKVLGSSRKSLVQQYLTESLLVTLASAILAVVLTRLTLPLLNQVADKQIDLTGPSLLWFIPALLLIVLLVAGLAGLYPALYLSAFKPIMVLKGKLGRGFKRSYLRGLLVVFQFSVSIFLIIGTVVVYKQLIYIQNKDLGFNKSHMLVIKNTQTLGHEAPVFKEELRKVPGIRAVTMSRFVPTSEERYKTGLFPQLPVDVKQLVLSEFWEVDDEYLPTMKMQLVQGRNFSRQLASDSSAIIVNEAFVRKFGFTDPLNREIYRHSFGPQTFHIVGVVKDFNYNSLRNDVQPLALVYGSNNGAITANIQGNVNLTGVLAGIEKKWKKISGGHAFTYSFMDADFDATYKAEQRMKRLFVSFSVLAIVIACLGLFGLTAYAAEQRNKEIAVRKVIGASTSNIVRLLSTDFIKLVIISILIASPIGWYAMNKWLQDFAYRIDMGPMIFLLAAAIALLIAFITVSFQSIRAAIANPVKSLRAE